MKKFSLLIINLCIAFFSMGQNCTPDQTITSPGIYPEFLDTASVGVSYEHTLQILAIKDTMVMFGNQTVTAEVDSVELKEILGLPNNFSYACEPARCTYTWQSVGCAKLSGNPTAADIGEHPLEIVIISHARLGSILFPTRDTITDFTLVVQDSNLSVISGLDRAKISLSPNPVGAGSLRVQSAQPCSDYALINPKGKLVLAGSPLHAMDFQLELDGLVAGVYTLVLRMDNKLYYRKLVRL